MSKTITLTEHRPADGLLTMRVRNTTYNVNIFFNPNAKMNRTYEAMFPLLGVALIYLVLVMLFTRLLAKFERRLAQSDR